MAVRSKKIDSTTISAKFAVKILLIMLIKVALLEDKQDISMKRYGFRTLVNKRQITARAKQPIIPWNLIKRQKKRLKGNLLAHSN